MRLTTIEKKIKTNIEKFITNSIDWVEDSEKDKERKSYYYTIETNKEDNRIEISFDGGMIWEILNFHGYIDDESVEEIFGISKLKLDYEPYASWRIDIYA
jgi:hypothetical protein